jgi:hypothetical protein
VCWTAKPKRGLSTQWWPGCLTHTCAQPIAHATALSTRSHTHLALQRQVCEEPGVPPHRVQGQALGGVLYEDAAQEVQAVGRQLQRGRYAVLHLEDALQRHRRWKEGMEGGRRATWQKPRHWLVTLEAVQAGLK